MANEQNLILFDKDQNREKARENGRKGGIASGKAKREKKAMRETLEILLSMPLTDGKETNIEKLKSFGKLAGKNITVQEAILIKQVQKALKGDTNSLNAIRELTGEKVTEIKVAQVQDDKIKELEAYINARK